MNSGKVLQISYHKVCDIIRIQLQKQVNRHDWRGREAIVIIFIQLLIGKGRFKSYS